MLTKPALCTGGCHAVVYEDQDSERLNQCQEGCTG